MVFRSKRSIYLVAVCAPGNHSAMFTVRLNKQGAVRKSRIYYLRGLRGKKAKIKELKK